MNLSILKKTNKMSLIPTETLKKYRKNDNKTRKKLTNNV